MVIVKEKQALNEMATVCKKADGYGMVIEVYSEDHGVIGNKSNPAHAHLKAPDNAYLGKFAITAQPPRDFQYVFDCDKTVPIPSEYKNKIARWAKDRRKTMGVTNWAFLKEIWNILHP